MPTIPCLRPETRADLTHAISDAGSTFGLLPGELRTIERLLEIVREVQDCAQ